MRISLLPLFLLAGAFLMSACQSEKTTPPESPTSPPVPSGALVIEAEDFRILESEVIDDPQASGGKAVRILSWRAFCSIEFSLPPGQYVVNTRMKAFDAEHDSFFLSVGKVVIEANAAVYNQYAYCPQYLEFSVTRPGKYFIQFAAFAPGNRQGETGLLIDRVEIWEKERWTAPR